MQGTFSLTLEWCVPEEGRRHSCPEEGISYLHQEWRQELFSPLTLNRSGLDRPEKLCTFCASKKYWV